MSSTPPKPYYTGPAKVPVGCGVLFLRILLLSLAGWVIQALVRRWLQ